MTEILRHNGDPPTGASHNVLVNVPSTEYNQQMDFLNRVYRSSMFISEILMITSFHIFHGNSYIYTSVCVYLIFWVFPIFQKPLEFSTTSQDLASFYNDSKENIPM